MGSSASKSVRRQKCVESFKTAHDCIGDIYPGIALFAITRGQFSMLDAILACLEQTGQAAVSLWTWTIAEYEIESFVRLQKNQKINDGLLVIDGGARNKNSGLIAEWKEQFGSESVRYVRNHAKIATIQNDKYRLLLRGSMNLNFNPRFEQFDITEGGPDFDIVKQIESEIPVLRDNASGTDVCRASRITDAFETETLKQFKGIKVWAK